MKSLNFEPLKRTSLMEKSAFWRSFQRRAPLIIITSLALLALAVVLAMSAQPYRTVGYVLIALLGIFEVLIVVAVAVVSLLDVGKKQKALQAFLETNEVGNYPRHQAVTSTPSSIRARNIVNQTIHYPFYVRTATDDISICENQVSLGGTDGKTIEVTYRIASFSLTKQYPHIFLDSKKNGTNLKYHPLQKIQLEGNFNKYFTLYAPDSSVTRIEALAILSPDVMQMLLTTAAPYDIEIEGHRVSLITQAPVLTYSELPRLIFAAESLKHELDHLDTTWHSVAVAEGKNIVLLERGVPLILAIILGVMLGVLLFWQSIFG